MLKNEYLKQWTNIVSQKIPHLRLPEVVGLATWSFGIVMTKSSSLSKVSKFIAQVNGEKANTVRQRLKEWYQEAKAKKGKLRRTLDVSSCFAPLLLWVISLLPANISTIFLFVFRVGVLFLLLLLMISFASIPPNCKKPTPVSTPLVTPLNPTPCSLILLKWL
ncbi:hypothetical protein [Nostoc sp. FACHB-280]|uniref:hypothetical protein n=1 Tax=Nostoc sp. FACHB-280 TaxID=2692839 RepID=UPI00168A63EA|nr:hypothetical protein [Nostoc sp. FACHB-280]MBD2494633.1 hypothetical protein [Nostoc sp. FACHB-280]